MPANEYQRKKKNAWLHRLLLLRFASLMRYFGYRSILGQLSFIFFLALLAITYIGNRHMAERMVRKTDAIEKELVELEWYYDTAKDELTRKSRQSEVAKLLRSREVFELIDPPTIIRVEDK